MQLNRIKHFPLIKTCSNQIRNTPSQKETRLEFFLISDEFRPTTLLCGGALPNWGLEETGGG